MKSETCGELFKALGEAQANFPSIPKTKTAKIRTKTGGEYSYSYADLSDVLDAIRKPLHGAGLAVTQLVEESHAGFVLTTMLGHSSGEFISSAYPLSRRETPQEMGSEITYARRYALVSILGLATEEDDDGASAQRSKRSASPRTSAEVKGQEPQGSGTAPAPKPPKREHTAEEVATKAKVQLYRSVCKGKKLDPDEFCKEFLAGGKSLEDVDLIEIESLIDAAKDHA